MLPAPSFADLEQDLKAIDKSIRLREYSQAVKLLQPLLKMNIAEAQYRMAGLYRSGLGVKKDTVKALAEYRKASISGLDDAQFSLASLLEKQGFNKQKMVVIQKWYQAAADQGHRKAKRKLASFEKRISAESPLNLSTENILSAIRSNSLDQIQACIESGVNLNFIDNKQRSPLMVALLSGHQEMSTLLIPVSKLLNKADSNNDRPLHIATSNGFSNIVLSLISKQVDINALDGLGNTALMIATRHDDEAIMSLLLDNKANHNIKNKKKQTAPQLAQILNLKQARLVFKQYNIKLPAKNLDYAKVDIKAFQKSVSKNSSLYKGWPFISIASLLGETAIVGQLLDQGVSIDASDTTGNNALHRAASKGQLKTLKLLVSRGSNINSINHKKQSALYIAAAAGQFKIINYLLKKGADTSLLAKNKASPLSIAISNKHSQSALALANKKLDNTSIHKALLLAIKGRMERLSVQLIKRDKLLLFAYSNNRSALWHSADRGLLKATNELLKSKKVDVNLSDKKGYSALARAINNGHEKVSNLLIKNGASLNTLTTENNSILMLAVLSGKSAIFKNILQQDKNINAKNNVGDTALMLAAGSGNNEFIKLLITSGADVQTRNKDDLNAYQIAINADHGSSAELIKENSGKLFKLFN